MNKKHEVIVLPTIVTLNKDVMNMVDENRPNVRSMLSKITIEYEEKETSPCTKYWGDEEKDLFVEEYERLRNICYKIILQAIEGLRSKENFSEVRSEQALLISIKNVYDHTHTKFVVGNLRLEYTPQIENLIFPVLRELRLLDKIVNQFAENSQWQNCRNSTHPH